MISPRDTGRHAADFTGLREYIEGCGRSSSTGTRTMICIAFALLDTSRYDESTRTIPQMRDEKLST